MTETAIQEIEPKVDLQLASKTATSDTKGAPISVFEAQCALIEAWLQKFGVRYSRVVDLPLTRINRDESRRSQTRERAIVSDLVDRLCHALRSGNTLPPGVGYRSGDQVVLIDGNNRDEAHLREGRETEPMFVLHEDTPTHTIDLMMVDANGQHGVTPSVAHRLRQGAMLVAKGWSLEQAAAVANVGQNTLQNHMRAAKAATRAARLRIKGFDELGIMSKAKIGVMASDSVFASLADMTIRRGLTHEHLTLLVRELKGYDTDSERLAHIAAYEEKLQKKLEEEAKANGAKEVFPARNHVHKNTMNAFSRLSSLDAGQILEAFKMDKERDDLLRRLEEVEVLISEIRGQLVSTNQDQEVS